MKSKEYEIEQYHFENEAEKEIKINKEQNEVSLKALDQQKNKAENQKLAKKKIYQKQ